MGTKSGDASVTTRKNSGANVGVRPRLNFIEGTNVTLTVADDAVDNEIDLTFTVATGAGLTILDTASIDLTLAAGVLSGVVLPAGVDHNLLANLTVGDVHTQYAFLTGRAGGQTLIGGTLASQNLTLQSTANATRGKILFGTSAYDEVNNRLGIAQASPTVAIQLGTSIYVDTVTPQIAVGTTNFGSYALYAFSGGVYTRFTLQSEGNCFLGTVGGKVHVGASSFATALLHLEAGVAAANGAPFKFTSGTNLTTPEAGAMEYDGTLLTFTPGTTRFSVILAGYGKAGGQTLIGGTAASETLTLQSTSHATKGKVLFGTSAYDEANNRLGIGTAAPATPIEVVGVFRQNTAGATLDLIDSIAIRTSGAVFFDSQAGGAISFRPNIITGMKLITSGFLAVGSDFTPTAVIHMKAGTASASTAPLKFTSGTNLTTPEAGAIEYDGTFLYFSPGATRRQVMLDGGVSTGAGTALLGSNCPAVTLSAPNTWISVVRGATTYFVPAWV